MNDVSSGLNITNYIKADEQDSIEQSMEDMIAAIRTHLDMDVGFVSEFTSTHRVFRHVNSRLDDCPVVVGAGDLLENSGCKKVVDGVWPQILHNAANDPIASQMPAVVALGVGGHISVPIILDSGEVYGTLCCFSFMPDPSLNERDLDMLRAFADLAAKQIQRYSLKSKDYEVIMGRIEEALNSNSIEILYQPIYNLETEKIVGFESLSRFRGEPKRSPDVWFKEAGQVGLGARLEMKAVIQALQALEVMPEGIYLSVNVSPETLFSGAIEAIFSNPKLHRVVVEITEHAYIDHYEDLTAIIERLRQRGVLLAVDDAGAGYASFRHILSLAPEVIKIDISITRDVDKDRARQALTSAFAAFSQATGSKVVAEGVETALELQALRKFGIRYAQGYFLAKPATLAQALLLLE